MKYRQFLFSFFIGAGLTLAPLVGYADSNPSVSANNATAPLLSTQIGIKDGSGKLQAASSSNPVPVSGTFWQTTQPISGTVAATQSGTWTVQPGNTANTTAWKVDGSAVTQPISGSISVSNFPATQPISGTVTANQGTANATPWAVSLAAETTKVIGTVNQGTSPWVISGSVTANAGTNLNTSALALESGGNLATLAGAVTSSIVQENVKQINGVIPLMGNGTTGTGSQRVTIASDNTAFSVNATATGAAANNATQSGNPLNNGCTIVTAEATNGTSGQAAQIICDKAHKVITLPYGPPETDVFGCATATGTSDTSLIAAQGANVKFYMTAYTISNIGASAANGGITFKDGSGGSTLWVSPGPAAGGSISPPTISIPGTANTALYFAASTASTTVTVCAFGHKGT